MAITWSRLHEKLGIDQARALSPEDLQQAVAENIGEDEALDFKAQRRSDEHAKAELAKDIAAMANTGGGLIVFGVGEAGESAEKHLVDEPIELTENAEQQIRSVTQSRVRPLVPGIVVELIPLPDDELRGYVLAQIPDSADAPHFYEKNEKDPPAAPRRHGPHTELMREREIERAYRDRFSRRAGIEQIIARRLQEIRERLVLDEVDAWVVGVACPSGSVPLGATAATRESAMAAVEASRGTEVREFARDPVSGRYHPATADLRSAPFPRRGLKRWVFPRSGQAPAVGITGAHLELHQDGTVVLALPVEARGDRLPRPAIAGPFIETACAAAVSLAAQWMLGRGISGTATVRLAAVSTATPEQPARLIRREGMHGGVGVAPGTPGLVNLEEVQATFAVGAEGELRAAGVELAEDFLHQFGWDELTELRQGG